MGAERSTMERDSGNPIGSVAVVGLGYVGLPLALAFGAKIPTIGFDMSEVKIRAYREGVDPNRECGMEEFQRATHIEFTTDPKALARAEAVVVCVPTPISKNKLPDLSFLEAASTVVGENISPGTVVIFESTVYPGVTEEVCGPIIERVSGLKCGEGFFLAYSPERINPGDKEHTLAKVVKVVAAQDPETLERVAGLYELVVEAGVHRAPSIKVAEAAKVIENTQRDLNIALMNELAIIFHRLGIDTLSVLEAAGTKWNFLPFRPGLVGGHCIGVDPYYLTYCAQMAGYHPEVILAGRRINDQIGAYVAQRVVKELVRAKVPVDGAKVLVMGITFKENCADVRNTRVVDIVEELEEYGIRVQVFDPEASRDDTKVLYDIELLEQPGGGWDGVVLAVAHESIRAMGAQGIQALLDGRRGVVVDVKGLFSPEEFAGTPYRYWRL